MKNLFYSIIIVSTITLITNCDIYILKTESGNFLKKNQYIKVIKSDKKQIFKFEKDNSLYSKYYQFKYELTHLKHLNPPYYIFTSYNVTETEEGLIFKKKVPCITKKKSINVNIEDGTLKNLKENNPEYWKSLINECEFDRFDELSLPCYAIHMVDIFEESFEESSDEQE